MIRKLILPVFVVLFVSFGVGRADPLAYWYQTASGTTNNLNGVTYANHLFIAVGNAGTVLTSSDGVGWSAQSSGTTNNLTAITYGGAKYVVVGANDTVLISTDATNWTVYANATGQGSGFDLNSVCFGNGKFVLTENNYSCFLQSGCPFVTSWTYTSVDGITWTQTYYTVSGVVSGINYGNGLYAFLLNGGVFRSYDTTNWTQTAAVGSLSTLTFANGEFLSEGSDRLTISTDATNWSNSTNFPNTAGIGPVSVGQDQYGNTLITVPTMGVVYTGTGVGTASEAWTSRSEPVGYSFSGIAYGQNPLGTGVFTAISRSNIVYNVVYTGAYVWTNTAGGNWSNPTNWNFHQVPGKLDGGGSPDDVQITAPGTYTVVFDEAVGGTHYWDIHSLTLGAGTGNGLQTLAMTNSILYAAPVDINGGGILNSSGSSYHVVMNVQNGGQIHSQNGYYFADALTVSSGGGFTSYGDTFHQSFVVDSGGTFSTQGATIDKDCSLLVNSGGTIYIPSGILYLYGPMTNSGSVSMWSNGGIYVYNDGTASYKGYLRNESGGVLNLGGGNGIQAPLSNSRVDNLGAIVCTQAGAQITATTFDTSSGSISNLSSGILSVSAFNNTLAGTFFATNNSTIQFSSSTTAPLVPGTPLVLAGGGQFRFSSGWLYYPITSIPQLVLSGGVLQLGPRFQGGAITNLALNGTTLTNALPVTGLLAVTNSSVYGNWTVQSGSLIAYGATIHGNVNIGSGATMTTPGTTFAGDGSLTVANGGALSIPTGVLYLYGPMTNSGIVSIYSNGGIYIYNYADANNLGGFVNLPPGVINLAGFNGFSGGNSHEYLINQGTINSSGGNHILQIPAFTNSGTMFATSGALYLDSGFHPAADGTLKVLFSSKNGFGYFGISGAVALNGTLTVQLNGSYLPSAGDSIAPVAYGSFTDSFQQIDLPPTDSWQITYGTHELTLQVEKTGLVPVFDISTLVDGQLVLSGTNGVPGGKYLVVTSSDVAAPLQNWLPIATNSFDANGNFSFTNAPDPAKPVQFFLLEPQ